MKTPHQVRGDMYMDGQQFVIAREQSDRGDLYKFMKHLNSRHSDGCTQRDTPEESHPSAGSRLHFVEDTWQGEPDVFPDAHSWKHSGRGYNPRPAGPSDHIYVIPDKRSAIRNLPFRHFLLPRTQKKSRPGGPFHGGGRSECTPGGNDP